MPKKLLNVANLMGDSLYILRPLDLYLEKFGSECVGFSAFPGFGGDIVRRHFNDRIPIYSTYEEGLLEHPNAEVLHLPAGRAMEIAADVHAKHHHPIHISEAFAFMLGVDVGKDIKPPLDWVTKYPTPVQKIAIISPFSRSCARHSGLKPNKTFDDWKWEYIIRYLRRHDYDVICVGGETDVLQSVSLPVSSYRSAETLDELLQTIQSASLVVSIDNGTTHIASACGVPTVAFWSGHSGVPPQFIAPLWADSTKFIMIGDVNEVQPAIMLYGLKTTLEKAGW